MSFYNKWRKFKQQKQLLLELDEEEVEQISGFLTGMKTDDLPFKHLFGQKNRILIPFKESPKDHRLEEWSESLKRTSWKVDWKSGIISREMINIRTNQARVEKMKIGKWLTKYIRLREKYQFSRADQGRGLDADILAIINPDSEEGRERNPERSTEESKKRLNSFVNFDWARDHTEEYAKKILDIYQKGRGEMTKMSIIFTRHPIDVLRMADFEHIQSCHSPASRGGEGSYYTCAIVEAHGHGALAYIVNEDQLMQFIGEDGNLEDLDDEELFSDSGRGIEGIEPLARLRMRRLVFKQKRTDTKTYDLAVPENRVYGPSIVGFEETVVRWLRQKQEDLQSLFPSTGDSAETIDLNQLTLVGGTQYDTEPTQMFKTLFPDPARGRDYYGFVKQDYDVESEILADLGLGTSAFEREVKYVLEQWDSQNFQIVPPEEDDILLDLYLRNIIPDVQIDLEVMEEYGNTFGVVSADMSFDFPKELFQERATYGRLWEDLGHIADEFKDMGVKFIKTLRSTIKGDTLKILLEFDFDDEEFISGGGKWLHTPDDMERVLDKLKVYHNQREGWRQELEMMFKRYNLIEGAALYNLAQEVVNQEFDASGWDTDVDDEYMPTELTADIWGLRVIKKNFNPPITDRVVSSREFKIALKKRLFLAAANASKSGGIEYPNYELRVTNREEQGYQLNLQLRATDDSSDSQVGAIRHVVANLDADDIQHFVDTALKDINSDETARRRIGSEDQASNLFENWRRYVKTKSR
tara:strand:+ start:39262 stop:41523 length:2262 start_codon:yes stop_codon:yes gene_type:complete